MIWWMVSETNPGPDPGIEDSAQPVGHASPAEASGSGEPTLEGAFSPDGVDLTAIRWMLDRSPEERLQAAQQLIDAAWALRGDEA